MTGEWGVCGRGGTHLGEVVEFCFSSCRNLANGDTGFGAGRVMLSITAITYSFGKALTYRHMDDKEWGLNRQQIRYIIRAFIGQFGIVLLFLDATRFAAYISGFLNIGSMDL